MNREREPKERVHERFKVFAPDAGIRETLHENGSPGSFLNAGKDARKRSEEIEPQESRGVGEFKASGKVFFFASECEASLPRTRIGER